MNENTSARLMRALKSAALRASDLADGPDKEFERGVRLVATQTVLSTLDYQYPAAGVVRSLWDLCGLDPTPFTPIAKVFEEAVPRPFPGTVSLQTAAAAIDGSGMGSSQRNAPRGQGAVFTPPELASFLAAEVIGENVPWTALRDQRVTDPACGAGSLLLAILAEGQRRLERSHVSTSQHELREWAISRLAGVDRDGDAAAVAATLLGLAIGISAEDVLDRGMVRVADSLLGHESNDSDLAYDLVIMNPPWIKIKDLNQYGYADQLKADSRYPLTTQKGRGDLDLYQFFLERAFALTDDGGRIGFIVPGSFLRSSRAARLRHLYLEAGHWLRLDEFWNQERIFPIHSMFRFVTGVFVKGAPPRAVNARFRLRSVEDAIKQPPKRLHPHVFTGAREGVARPIPEVATPSDASLFRKIATQQPSLGSATNSWSALFRFRRELDMTTDRHLFLGSSDIDDRAIDRGLARRVYEGRMVHQFDSAAKTYRGGTGRSAEWGVWLPGERFDSQFCIDETSIPPELIDHVSKWRAGFCDVTGHANERTVLAAMIPPGAVCGNKVPTVEVDDPRLHFIWIAIANSFVIDWFLRRSVTTTLNFHYLLETPFPWIAPSSTMGQSLIELSKSLSTPLARSRTELWQRAHARAEIDCLVAGLFSLNVLDLRAILADFPLLDRGQPSPEGDRSTITRDFLLANYAHQLGATESRTEARVEAARSAGAIPYVPGELAAVLSTVGGTPMRRAPAGTGQRGHGETQGSESSASLLSLGDVGPSLDHGTAL